MSMDREPDPARVPAMRSILSVPANRPEFFEKAARGPADVVFLDLEDAVFAEHKLAARENARQNLDRIAWGKRRVLVRINGLDTEWGFRDLVDLGATSARLDGVMVPKIGSVDDLRYVEQTLQFIERERPAARPLELHILIETALGLARIEEILERATRLASVTFGLGDYMMSLGLHGRRDGRNRPDYVVLGDPAADGARPGHWNDNWHHAMARLANACHAFNVVPIDGPSGNIADMEGHAVAIRRARALGFQGKWAIHPTQIEAINAAFGPSEEDVAWARAVRTALDEARRAGRGAARHEGRLIEAATLKSVDRILAGR